MQQLIMYWQNDGKKAQMPELPENIAIKTLKETQNAVDKWLDIVQYGLSDKRETAEFFDRALTNWPNYDENKTFFVLENGKEVATVTVICNYETADGYIHMVCAVPECRGKGIGALLNNLSVYVLKREGMKTAHLTTDDFRIPAIKGYLRAGFVPDKSTDDFKKRWSDIMEKINKKGAKQYEFIQK